jgi:protein SCO1/2
MSTEESGTRLSGIQQQRQWLRFSRVGLPACLVLILASLSQAQQSFGSPSNEPPNEDRYVYRQVPDIQIKTTSGPETSLSAFWQQKPVLLTMIFTRCAGVCSPFLHSLKSAAADAGGLGKDYRVLVLSFDPKDTVADMHVMADSIGVRSDPDWIFGVASPSDIQQLAAASGFWFRWDASIQQYDHPSLVVAVDRGRVVRMLAGATVPSASLREVVQEMRGKFVASYAIAGKVAFRCFEYDPQSGRYSLDWGVLLMLLPAAGGILATIWAFFLSRQRRPSRLIIRYLWPFPRVSPGYRNDGLVPPKSRMHSAKSNLGVMHVTTTESSDVGPQYRVRVRLSKS